MKKNYNNIFIVDSKAYFDAMALYCDVQNDLVLTYDFALKKYVEDLGGNVQYLDHLVDIDKMQDNNYLIYKFFTDWHYDKDGNDIFTFKDVPFGFSFRLDFWNDFVFYTRIFLSLKCISRYSFQDIYILSDEKLIFQILDTFDIKYKIFYDKSSVIDNTGYYFPIAKWLDSKIKPIGFRGFLYKAREKVSFIYGKIMPFVDKLFKPNSKYTVFIQDYHPTKRIIQHFRNDNDFTVLLEHFSRFSNKKDNLKERLLPIGGDIKNYEQIKNELLKKFESNRFHRLILSDGSDITDAIYDIIKNRISSGLSKKLRTLDSCIKYLDKNKVDLVILIANLGHIATLFDLVCKHKKIPSYLIINGMLLNNYQDEAHYATYINSYSNSIKENYFRDIKNVYALGDPRMDTYSLIEKNKINREFPTITIGTSGFNSTDLNSYVAVEFDFMYDILKAFSVLKQKGEKFKLIIQVRPNGYEKQYQSFINEYFNDLKIETISTIPMIEVLKKTDFYISIYSQTLFEASCLGIPVVYYKKDTEITNKPFDNNSELVTILNTDDMIQAFYDFKANNQRYELFLNSKVMEQYIGFLDGNNLTRNIDFIYKILRKESLK